MSDRVLFTKDAAERIAAATREVERRLGITLRNGDRRRRHGTPSAGHPWMLSVGKTQGEDSHWVVWVLPGRRRVAGGQHIYTTTDKIEDRWETVAPDEGDAFELDLTDITGPYAFIFMDYQCTEWVENPGDSEAEPPVQPFMERIAGEWDPEEDEENPVGPIRVVSASDERYYITTGLRRICLGVLKKENGGWYVLRQLEDSDIEIVDLALPPGFGDSPAVNGMSVVFLPVIDASFPTPAFAIDWLRCLWPPAEDEES